MRVLLTSTGYPPAIGGAQLHTHQIAVELARHHDVSVITQWSTTRTDWLLGTTVMAPAASSTYEIDGVPVHQIGLGLTEKLRLAPYALAYYVLQGTSIRHISGCLLDRLEALAPQPDVVHNVRIGREPLSFASCALARRRGVPFFLTPLHHPRWQGRRYRHYQRLYRLADGVIALTQAEKRTLVELGVDGERIHVTGIGPILAPAGDGERFRRRHEVTGPMVLFLGQKYRYKNMAPLLQAAPVVWKRVPDACFAFLGPRTPYSRRLFRSVRDRRIIELPSVDLQEKTDALMACDLLCLPSSQESFGGVFVEAWMMGKPVIGARIPAVEEVISDGNDGLLTEPTAPAIAEKVLAVLQDGRSAVAMGRAGRAKAEDRFTWDKITATIEHAYAATMSGR